MPSGGWASPARVGEWLPVSASPARVILLAGPSGSGKSSLAARAGLPVLRARRLLQGRRRPDAAPAARRLRDRLGRPGLVERGRGGRRDRRAVRGRCGRHPGVRPRGERRDGPRRAGPARRAGLRRRGRLRRGDRGPLPGAGGARRRAVPARPPVDDRAPAVRPGSARGPQVRAVPGPARLAPDAGRARHRRPAGRAGLPPVRARRGRGHGSRRARRMELPTAGAEAARRRR